MIPILYEANETLFDTNGLGGLSDAATCIVTEERNGQFELEMTYPIKGRHYNDIKIDRLIYAKPSVDQESQPFEIYKISKPIGGMVTINAHHISYRGAFIPVKPFSVEEIGAVGVVSVLNRKSEGAVTMETNPFTIILDGSDWSKKTDPFVVSVPQSYRSCIGGKSNSSNQDTFISKYGGEIKYDKFNIYICGSRGRASGVRIAYSKNLTDLQQVEDGSEQVTGIYPYYESLQCGPVYSEYADLYPYKKTIPMDFKQYFTNTPTSDELKAEAEKYVKESGIGKPSVNLTVSFVALGQTEEYKNIMMLEEVRLCDTVIVEFKALGVESESQVITTKYNVLAERYESLTLGESKSSLESTIINIDNKFNDSKNDSKLVESRLMNELVAQTALINGSHGGYMKIIRDNNNNPTELVFGDNEDISKMKNCLRINQKGIGFSTDGYGTNKFKEAWTIDGKFSAEFITTGVMHGDRIEAGTIKSGSLEIASNNPKYTSVKSVTSEHAPDYVSNAYYSYENGVYTLLTGKPEDWNNNYKNYYEPSKYKKPITVEWKPDTYYSGVYDYDTETWTFEVTAIKPSDWDELYFEYYTKDDTSELGYTAVIPIWISNTYYSYENGVYTLLTEKPEDWNYNNMNYYEPSVYTQAKSVTSEHAPDYVSNVYYSYENGVYTLLTGKPEDWNNNYRNYYYREDESVFGDWIRIGTDKTTGKPTLKIHCADSNIHLVQTNNRLSFVEDGTGTELAYISDKRFYAPTTTVQHELELIGFKITRSNGLIFQYVGGE